MNAKMTLDGINALTFEDFVRAIGPIFEHSTWIAADTSPKRPFETLKELHSQLCHTVKTSTPEKQLALIRAHPDLVGKAALAGQLTYASNAEQASAGLNRLTPEEIVAFQDFNRQYRDKFGFPFVVCA